MKRLQIMAKYGVDRLTIGSQSLHPEILKLMFRRATVDMIMEAVDNCRNKISCVDYRKINQWREEGKEITQELLDNTQRRGFILNLEFIFGFMGINVDIFADTVERACLIHQQGLIDEIQLYRLKVDAYGDFQGIIGLLYDREPSLFPDFEENMLQKAVAEEILKLYGLKGNLRRVYTTDPWIYSHYAYNQCCMLFDQMSFGQTAFSSLRDRFVLNTQYFDEYYQKISEGKLPFNRGYVRDAEAQQRWCIILPLKNWTFRKRHFKSMTGVDVETTKFWPILQKLKKFGLVEEVGDNVLQLTKLGAFFADEVVECFYDPRFIPFGREYYNEGPLNPYVINEEMAEIERSLR